MNNIPENANKECPGTNDQNAGKLDNCKGCPNQNLCSTGKMGENAEDIELIEKMSNIKHKLLVLSGKGGVGKSTVCSQMAFYLSELGYEVGLLDLDICGPSIPKIMGLENQEVHKSNSGWSPIYVKDNLAVMSIGFLLPNKDDAVIWRGPKKNGLIRQFLVDVDWGNLDFLLIDTPPGTSDEHISIVKMLNANENDGGVIVTTPQEIALNDVKKELNFCKKTNLNIIGVVENMKVYTCPHCNKDSDLFENTNEIKNMCDNFNTKILGSLSFSRKLNKLSEKGKGLWDSEESEINVKDKKEFENIVGNIKAHLKLE